MFIDVSEVRKSFGQTFHFDQTEGIKPLLLDGSEIVFRGLLNIGLDIQNTGRVLVLRGTITGDTELTCNRCLETYPYHLETGFEEEYAHASDEAEMAGEGQKTEDIHVFAGNRLNLGDTIRESILLGLPMKSLCREDCRGLCAVCGTNLNDQNCGCEAEKTDPRLEILKKYFKS